MAISNSFPRNVVYDVLVTVIAGVGTSAFSTVISGSTLEFTQLDLIIGTFVSAFVGVIVFGLTVTTSKDLLIEPINESGENIFHVTESGGLGKRPQEFWVKLRFYLRSRYSLTITKFDLQYQRAINPTRRDITVEIDGKEYPIDGNYRLNEPAKIPAEELVEIFLRRDYQVWDTQRANDYEDIVLEMEVLAPDWRSMKTVQITGELESGGEFNISSVEIDDGWLISFAEGVRRYIPVPR